MQVPGAGMMGWQGVWTANGAKVRERHEPPLLARLSRPFVGFVLQVILFLSAQMLDLQGTWCILSTRAEDI